MNSLTLPSPAIQPTAPRKLSSRQVERRRRILDVTYRLLADLGYDGVSMKLIAAEAGVAERTLFNIYATKDALLASSARERTELILAEAWKNAADHGVGFFLSLCETLSRRTLESPDVARALAPVLIQHAELVGLNGVYRHHLGQVLAELVEAEALDPTAATVLATLCGMHMVNTVILWAGHVIDDATLETHMRLAVCQILLPHARGQLHAWALAEANACVASLGQSATDRT